MKNEEVREKEHSSKLFQGEFKAASVNYWAMRHCGIIFILFSSFLPLYSLYPPTSRASDTLVFLSDTQKPLWIEAITRKNEHNRDATLRLFDQIKNRRFSTLFILGDITGASSRANYWADVDRLTAYLTENGMRIEALPGNHERMFGAKQGMENYVRRFPRYRPIQTVVIDSIAVLLVDGNLLKKEGETLSQQLSDTLTRLDLLPEVRVTVVCCHFPPFTNSTIVSSSKAVQRWLVPAFEQSAKTRLFLSGHSHNLEWFERNGKQYGVIGGGGGLRQPLRKKPIYTDLIPVADKPRFFYLTLSRQENQLHIGVEGIKNVEGVFHNYTLSVP